MSTRIDRNDVPVVSGVVAGVAAWVVGYVLTYAVTAGSIRNSLIGQLLQNSDGGGVPQAVGLVFYNAHFVQTVVEAGFLGSSAVSFIGGENGFTPVLYVVPVVVLLAAGVAVAVQSDADDAAAGAKAGGTVAVGYLVVSVVGVFIMQVGSGSTSAAPDLVTGIVLAGVLYPAIVGVVGGALGGELVDR
ncbi:hypothetical protein [Halosegnis longus]|uniref:DUF7978 domain-containing protein n=1 Tax=Halosegnis longus TaxID=2216012 RepID=A0AAJ4R8K9_9EURY|nr:MULTISPECIES: hypothetical protein [Halobacteriales]RNJ26217.1 hypothetical protein Nmn1133_05695 [Salella cibi]